MNQFGAGPSQPTSTESLSSGLPPFHIGRLLRVIRKRLWLAAVVAAVFVVLSIAYVLTATKIYQSSAVIYVDPKNEGAAFNGLKGANQASWQTPDALKSVAAGIRNGSVILRVVDTLDLRNNPEFLSPKEGGYTDFEIVILVSQNVKAELRRGTRLIDISVKDKSPVRAQQMTASFIEEFQAMIREQNLASADKLKEELQEKAKNQLVRVLEAEDALQAFRLKHADIAFDEDKYLIGKKLADLDKQLSSAANETLIKKVEYDQYMKVAEADVEGIVAIGQFGNQDQIQKLLLQRNQKRAEFSRVKEQFRPGYQTYDTIKRDLDELELQVQLAAKKIGNSIEKAYYRAKEHEDQLRISVDEQKQRLLTADDVGNEFRTLKGKVAAASAIYQTLLDRIDDTDATTGVDETVIRVFSKPLVPSKPVSPKKKLTVAIAGVLGSVVGMGLVILLGLLDRTLNTRKQVEATLGLSVLAEIPKAFDRELDLKDSVFVTRDPSSMVSRGFRSFRTSLSARMARSVMVTSASPGEGKSFCSANLAVLQANKGYRTLLVDADFCKPRMAEIFVDPLRGQADQGSSATQKLCQETIFKDLFLMSCERYTSKTGEPMKGEIFAKMLQDAYQAFDCVIVDTSSLNVISDGLDYSRHADAVVLVVKSGETKVDAARRSMRELQRIRANLVGCVLNSCDEINKDQLD
ncbi:Wzz/FepE/Etk N-terminal domain-containing protein [Verrucomicrobiales bacterium]|jgi:succinoglycan biosynthesis transport protein ExoP|nr:Wzz/FepE/Etk N-terminal domain-containing protein [Verrucomicrobiales bacterium]